MTKNTTMIAQIAIAHLVTPSSWAISDSGVLSAAEFGRLRLAMESWLTEHEGDDLSIEVRDAGRDIEGTYLVDDRDGTLGPLPEELRARVDGLLERAFVAAAEAEP